MTIRRTVVHWGLAHEFMRLFIQFRMIEEIESLPIATSVDIIGVVESVEYPCNIARKDNSETRLRNIALRDNSDKSIEFTLWGDHSTNFGDRLEEVKLSLILTPLHL
jgi:hypothetical protein